MIFSAKLARLVIEGKKTQTRRRIKPGEDYCRYKAGRDYAVQVPAPKDSKARARTKEGVRIEVLDVRSEPLSGITYEDALAEGFKSREEFFDYWCHLYGERADLGELVWVIAFKAQLDIDRYLHVDSSRGYTNRRRDGLPDEPPAVDEETQERITENSLHTYNLVHAEQLAKRDIRSLGEKLQRARADAAKKGIDISPDVERIKAEVEQLRQKIGEAA